MAAIGAPWHRRRDIRSKQDRHRREQKHREEGQEKSHGQGPHRASRQETHAIPTPAYPSTA